MTVCIQCSLAAFVANGGEFQGGAGVFDETPEAHMARVHPTGVDPAVRAQLEADAVALMLRRPPAPAAEV